MVIVYWSTVITILLMHVFGVAIMARIAYEACTTSWTGTSNSYRPEPKSSSTPEETDVIINANRKV